jgi:hypothetical protein
MLASVVDAQAQAARATVDFVEDIGFEATAEGDRLRNVKVRYFKKDENGQRAEFEVEVPLLALVNVPSLAVKQAVLTFGYDVVTATAGTTPTTPSGSSALPAIRQIAPAILKGFVRPATIAPSGAAPATTAPPVRRTTAVDLQVTLEQQEVPVGVERLFDLAELGIAERPMPGSPS